MTPQESCEKEIARFFKKYYEYTASSDSDDLKDLLAVICSSVEKFEKAFYNISKNNKRYIALKALRNFSTHKSELLNDTKAIDFKKWGELRSDVSIVCLIPKKAFDFILRDTSSAYTRSCITESFIIYDNFINIYPAIFNFAVDLYLLVKKENLNISNDGFNNMDASIQYEIANGYPHYISGVIISLNSLSVSQLLDKYTVDISTRESSRIVAKECDNGMRSVIVKHENPREQLKCLSYEDKKFIFDELIATKAIEIEGGDVAMNRHLIPVEILIVEEFKNKE